jgi:hypothetical protein
MVIGGADRLRAWLSRSLQNSAEGWLSRSSAPLPDRRGPDRRLHRPPRPRSRGDIASEAWSAPHRQDVDRVRELGFADVRGRPISAKAVEGCDGVILCVPVGAYAASWLPSRRI